VPPRGALAVKKIPCLLLVLQTLALPTLMLPSYINLDISYVPKGVILQFVEAMDCFSSTVGPGPELMLTNGFVLVQQADPRSNSPSSSNGSSSVEAAIPWHLRKLAAVHPAPAGDRAEAVLELVGGDTVLAGDIYEGRLDEVQDYEVRPAHCLKQVGDSRYSSARMAHVVRLQAG
jgi:hypothetical protein